VKAIIERPRPTNVTEIRSFLGLARYYRRFVRDFSKVTYALTNLLKNTTKFEWIEKCERAFQEVRQHLTTVSILTLSIEGKQYTVYSDVSRSGLGCVLM